MADYSQAIEGFSRGFIKAREEKQAQLSRTGQTLFDTAKANPDMFDDPNVRKSLEAYVGDKEAYELLKNVYQGQARAAERAPYEQAKMMGAVTPADAANVDEMERQAVAARTINSLGPPPESALSGIVRGGLGAIPGVGPRLAQATVGPAPTAPRVDVPQPYAGFKEKTVAKAQTTPGATVSINPKGGVTVGMTGPSRAEAGEVNFYQAVEARRRELEGAGMGEVAAHLQSLKDASEYANANGLIVPKEARELANWKTTQQVKVGLAAATKATERAIERATEAGIRFEGERGQREARSALPISEDEQIFNTARTYAEGVVSDPELGLTPQQQQALANRIATDTAIAKRQELGVKKVEGEAAGRERGAAAGKLAPGPTGAPTQQTSDTVRTRMVANQKTADSIGDVFKLVDPKMLGQLRGRVVNVEGWLGTLGIKEERFRAAIDNTVRTYRMTTTGQGASEGELERLKKELLDTKQSPEKFFARMIELTNRIKSDHSADEAFAKANNEITVPLSIDPELQSKLDLFAGEGAPAPSWVPPDWNVEVIP